MKMATTPQNNCTSYPPIGSPEWQARVDAEIAARPVTNKVRRAITPAEFDSYKPKAGK
jgi:hypothetical protein